MQSEVNETRAEYHSGATKKAVNLSLNANLLEEAKASGINLSRFLEAHLRDALFEQRKKRFEDENREFIDTYNAYIDQNGTSHSRMVARRKAITAKVSTRATS